MIRHRRRLLGLGTLALTGAWAPWTRAQSLDKPVRVIVAYGAGSATDMIVRFLGERIGKLSGRPVVVENKPGADGNIAAEAALHAQPDAYTLLASGASTHAANVTLYKKLNFDPEADFTPLAPLAAAPFILVVNPERVRARTLKDFVGQAAAGGKPLTFAATSVGNRIAGERFRQAARLPAAAVPYRASAQAMTDLIGAQFDYYFCDTATALPQIRAGKIVPLAVSARERLAAVPEVPTVAEAMFPDFDVVTWIGIWSANASTPADVATRLSGWIAQTLESAEGREFLTAKGLVPMPGGAERLRTQQRRDTVEWGKVIREIGLAAGA